MSYADHFERAVMELVLLTPEQWATIPVERQQDAVHRHGQQVWNIVDALHGRQQQRNGTGHLPGIYRRPDFTVGTFVTRRERRWTVALRLPDGGMIHLAEYRWHWRAALWVRRSWKLAQR